MRRYQLCGIFAVSIFLQCGPLSGTSTETTNGICIEISETRIAGTTLPGVSVTLCSRNYTVIDTVGPKPRMLVVGTNGSFEFPLIDSGVYVITAFTPESDSGGCIVGIRAGKGSLRYADTALFEPVGAITGSVKPDSTGYRIGTIVCLYGTTLADTAGTSNIFSLPGVPAGSFSIGAFPLYDKSRVAGSKPGDTNSGIFIEVKPGQTREWNF